LKKKYPDKIILLYGNHDIQYSHYPNYRCSGFQQRNHLDYMKLFQDNLDLFQMSYQIDNTLWSHAGVHIAWYNEYIKEYHDNNPEMTLSNILNNDFDNQKSYMFNIGKMRSGFSDVGGPLWLDRRQLWNKPLPGYHQIVGHTKITYDNRKYRIGKKHPKLIRHFDIERINASLTCIDVLTESNPEFYTKEFEI